MSFNRPSILAFLFGHDRHAAAERARRWSRAFRDNPELARDVIELGHVLELAPARFEDGVEQPDPVCPYRAMREQGARDLAVKLLALGGTTVEELINLTKE